MELAAGTRVGPYEIQRRIGAGGMGVVYRALDHRLGRAVAIKVLPESLVENPDRLRRFEQEARTIGSLNHPNLVTLHDVGHYDDAPYLVTELLDGQSLRAKLADGSVSRREAIEIATELAHGLAAAHGAGIVHRDIKPDNVFVLADGRVKILDFGIAKLKRGEQVDLGNAPTGVGNVAGADVTAAATGTGIVIGTPGYMAPEQLAGGEIDARTDIFALGVVLYEMIARKRPFAADSSIEESYGIMKTDPGPLPPNTPPALARIVLRCLAKRPDARFQSAADLGFALDALEGSGRSSSEPSLVEARTELAPATLPPPTTTTTARPRAPGMLWVIAGLGLLALGAATAIILVSISKGSHASVATKPDPHVEHVTPHWPSQILGGPQYTRVTFHAQAEWFARFAPDGKSVLYSVRDEAPKTPDELAQKVKDRERWNVVRSLIDQPSMIELGQPGRLLDVRSENGLEQLALRRPLADKEGGILSTVVVGTGGALDRGVEVHTASFGPKGELAVVRFDPKGSIVEYPLGTKVYEPAGVAVQQIRVAPDGQHLAVLEHVSGATSERISILDAHGAVKARASRLAADGIAWSGDRDVWYSAGAAIYEVGLDTADHVILRSQLPLQLRDVDADRRMLVAPIDQRVQLYVGASSGPFAPMAWFDAAELMAVSGDGNLIAFALAADATAEGHAIYVRAGAGAPTLLGHGEQVALVPDGSAAVVLGHGASLLSVIPTTGGTPRELSTAGLEDIDFDHPLAISTDGAHVIVRAGKPGHRRAWSVPLDGGAPAAVGLDHDVSPTYAAATDRLAYGHDHGVAVVAVAGGTPQIFTAPHAEQPIRFSSDGKALFVIRQHGWPKTIERIELATGKRSTVAQIPIAEKREDFRVAISADGGSVAYSVSVQTSDLYVIHQPR